MGPRFIFLPITLIVIEGGTGPNVFSIPFDANTAISVGLLPEGLAYIKPPSDLAYFILSGVLY